MVYVCAKFLVKDECIEDFRRDAKTLVGEKGEVIGNIACDLFESIEQKNTFRIMEVWNDMSVFEAYRQTERYSEMTSALKSYSLQVEDKDIFKMVM